jgi:hypothetical protein
VDPVTQNARKGYGREVEITRDNTVVLGARKNNLTPNYAEPNSRPGTGRATSESIAEWFEVGRPVPGRLFDPVTLF